LVVGASGRKGPPLPSPVAELGGADQRLAGVDPHVELDRREDAAVLLVQAGRALGMANAARVAFSAWSVGCARTGDDHQAVAGRLVHVAVVALDDFQKARE